MGLLTLLAPLGSWAVQQAWTHWRRGNVQAIGTAGLILALIEFVEQQAGCDFGAVHWAAFLPIAQRLLQVKSAIPPTPGVPSGGPVPDCGDGGGGSVGAQESPLAGRSAAPGDLAGPYSVLVPVGQPECLATGRTVGSVSV